MAEIQSSLHAVAETARKLATRAFETESRPRVRAELIPAVLSVIDGAVNVLDEVLERYDKPLELEPEPPASSGVFDRLIDDFVIAANDAGPGPGQRVADMSFMARWELGRKRSAVAEAEHSLDDWRLLAECCSARRRVVKAATGVERVLSEVEGLPSLFADLYRTEKQRAVETRAAYYAFVTGLRAAEQGHRADVERGLRLAGTGIAQLIGREVYEDLRVDDRRSLRALQVRVFAWLRGARDEREGQRLLSELNAFGSLLMEVNRRPPLIEYDRELLGELLGALEQPRVDAPTLYRRLTTLRGRDAELDALINLRAELRPNLWRPPVEQVLAGLDEQQPN